MKKIILTLSLICLCSTLAAQIKAPQLSLSLEECLAVAEKESLAVLISELSKQELDDEVLRRWLNYIPEVFYEQIANLSNDKIFRDGVETEEERSFSTVSAIRFSQRLFDQQLVDLINNENNLQLKKQIIELSSRSSIFFVIREAYYNALIYQQKLQNLETFHKKISMARQAGTDFFTRLLDYKIQEFLATLEMHMVIEKQNLQAQKQILLNSLNKSFESELVLTSPLSPVKPLSDDDKEDALQNNVFLKRYMLDKIQHERNLSKLASSYLPDIHVSLFHDINDDVTLRMEAEMSGSCSVMLDGDIRLMEQNYNYDFTAGRWIEDISPLSYYSNNSEVRLAFYFPIDKIFDTKIKKKEINRELKELELKVESQVIEILKNLQIYSSRTVLNDDMLKITAHKLTLKQEILEFLSGELVLTEMSDVQYYLENLYSVRELIDSVCIQQRQKYRAWNDLQTEIESGTRFESNFF